MSVAGVGHVIQSSILDEGTGIDAKVVVDSSDAEFPSDTDDVRFSLDTDVVVVGSESEDVLFVVKNAEHSEVSSFGRHVNLLIATSAGATQHINEALEQMSVAGVGHVIQSAIFVLRV